MTPNWALTKVQVDMVFDHRFLGTFSYTDSIFDFWKETQSQSGTWCDHKLEKLLQMLTWSSKRKLHQSWLFKQLNHQTVSLLKVLMQLLLREWMFHTKATAETPHVRQCLLKLQLINRRDAGARGLTSAQVTWPSLCPTFSIIMFKSWFCMG